VVGQSQRRRLARWLGRRQGLNYLDVEASLRLPIARGGRLVHWPVGWGPMPGIRAPRLRRLGQWWRTGGRS
jgi:hypothetical protein